MKNKLRYVIAAVLLFVCCPFAVACGETASETPDYGTLTIKNITLEEGTAAEIEATFSTEEGKGEIAYTFEGDNISIAGGKVTALKPDTTTTVTAKTAHHEVTFTVTVTKKAVDYGTLTIKNITLENGGVAEIEATFSTEEGKDEIAYTFEGDNISIADGKVTALKPDTKTTVTAKTAHHEVTFTVTVKPVNYGMLTITSPAIYANYPAKPLNIVFSKPEYAEDITYTVQSGYESAVKIEDGKIYATGSGFSQSKSVRVTAKTAHHATVFTVNVSEFNGANKAGASLNFESRISSFLSDYENRGMTKGGALFVGDSFFDTRSFWTEFYTTYARKNAYSVGISSSTTTDWDILAERLVYPLEPTSIIFHCGTNNIFDDDKNADRATADIKRTLESFHTRLPQAKIYYFGIEPRNYTHVGNGYAKTCNAQIEAYASARDWLVYIDSPSFCYNSDGTINGSFYKSGDTVHPSAASYALYVNALEENGLTIPLSSSAQNTEIKEIVMTSSQSIANGDLMNVVYRGLSLKNEFVLTGKIDVTVVDSNPHIQFGFHSRCRFLIWDSNTTGSFGIGWRDASNSHIGKDVGLVPYTKNVKVTIPFKLAITSKNAYFYLGSENGGTVEYTLKAVCKNVTTFSNLAYGTEAMNSRAYDLVAKTKADDSAEYAALTTGAEFTKYENAGGSEYEFVRA